MKETTYSVKTRLTIPVGIALISDLHNESGDEVIASLKAHQKTIDLVAITGDFLIGYNPNKGGPIVAQYKNVLPFMSACSEIAPTYVSLGNHEWLTKDEDMRLLEDAGAVVLDNRWISHTFYRDGVCDVVVGGLTSSIVTYYRNLHEEMPYKASRYQTNHNAPESDWLTEFEAQPGLKILLSHHPEYWNLKEPFLSNHPIDLVLSGHAHGGQFRFLGQGLMAPGQGFFPKYTSGVHQGPHGNLIISRGLSNTAHPIPRLFNSTEVVYIEAN